MELVDKNISLKRIHELAEERFGNLVKAVVDVEKEIMVVGGELHSDEETLLLSKSSKQENLWGINLYPKMGGEDFIEYDSMINVRPSFGNTTRGVDDEKVKKKIKKVVSKLVEK